MPRSTRRTTAAQPVDGKENQANQAREPSKKARHRLSTTELARLEDVFKQDTHPSRQQKRDLAAQLGMDYKTITIWFQNKRQTSKRSGERTDTNWRRARADSCLRTVSSPSRNATLGSEVETDESVQAKVESIASKAIEKIKPLFDTLNALTSRSERPEPTDEALTVMDTNPHQLQMSESATVPNREATSEGSNATDTDPRQPQTSDNVTEPDRHAEQEQPKGNAKYTKWKRVRTLEWACERQSKRHKLSREGYVRLRSEEVQDGDPDDAHMDPALSLLSLAASARASPSQDIVRGASLLLSFKHSWHRR